MFVPRVDERPFDRVARRGWCRTAPVRCRASPARCRRTACGRSRRESARKRAGRCRCGRSPARRRAATCAPPAPVRGQLPGDLANRHALGFLGRDVLFMNSNVWLLLLPLQRKDADADVADDDRHAPLHLGHRHTASGARRADRPRCRSPFPGPPRQPLVVQADFGPLIRGAVKPFGKHRPCRPRRAGIAGGGGTAPWSAICATIRASVCSLPCAPRARLGSVRAWPMVISLIRKLPPPAVMPSSTLGRMRLSIMWPRTSTSSTQ